MGNVAVKHRYFHIRYEASTPNNSATIALSDYSRPTIHNYAVSMNGTYLSQNAQLGKILCRRFNGIV